MNKNYLTVVYEMDEKTNVQEILNVNPWAVCSYSHAIHERDAARQKIASLQEQAVATIYVTEDGSREVDDWKVTLPVGATTLYSATQPTAQAQKDAKDAARYRFLRDGKWRDTALEMIIVLQRNSLWDSKIDAAIAAQKGITHAS